MKGCSSPPGGEVVDLLVTMSKVHETLVMVIVVLIPEGRWGGSVKQKCIAGTKRLS